MDELGIGHDAPADVDASLVGDPVEPGEGGLVVQLLALLEELGVDLAQRVGMEEPSRPQFAHVGQVVLVLGQEVLVGDPAVDELELLAEVVQGLEGGGFQRAVAPYPPAPDLTELGELEPQVLEILAVVGDLIGADLFHGVQAEHDQVVPSRSGHRDADEVAVVGGINPRLLLGRGQVRVFQHLIAREILVEREEGTIGDRTDRVGVAVLDVDEVGELTGGQERGQTVTEGRVRCHPGIQTIHPEPVLELLPHHVAIPARNRRAPQDLEARGGAAVGRWLRHGGDVVVGMRRSQVDGGDPFDVAGDHPIHQWRVDRGRGDQIPGGWGLGPVRAGAERAGTGHAQTGQPGPAEGIASARGRRCAGRIARATVHHVSCEPLCSRRGGLETFTLGA